MSCIEYKDYSEQYRLLEKLGNGNCAAVMKVEDRKTKETYALKYAKFDSPTKLAVAFQEIEVVRAVEHETAIKVYYYFIKNSRVASRDIELGIIMELANRSLEQDIFLRRKKSRYFSLEQIETLVNTLLDFFAHCQFRGYLHRDIKPSNILLVHSEGLESANSNDVRYKVCDFGFAIRQHEFSDKNIAGTATYASPKIQSKFKNSNLFVLGNNYKDDVYSLGITLLQACTLESVELMTPQKLLQKVNARFGLKLTALLQLMLEFEQDKRPDFLQLVKLLHLFLTANLKSSNPVKPANHNVLSDDKIDQILISSKYLGINEPHTAASENCEDTKSEEISGLQIGNQEFANSLQSSGSLKKQEREQKFDEHCPPTIIKKVIRNRVNKFPFATQTSLQLEAQHSQLTHKDKIRTKRRSKTNKNEDQCREQIYRVLDHEFSEVYPADTFTSIKPNITSQFSKELSVLHKFASSVRCIETIELKNKGYCSQSDVLICVGLESRIFVGIKSDCGLQTTEIGLDDIASRVSSLKYIQSTNKLMLALEQNLIMSLHVDKLVTLLQLRPKLIPIHDLVSSRWQTLTANLCQVISDRTDELTRVYKNGNIFMSNRFVFSWPKRVMFAIKLARSILLATSDGCIAIVTTNLENNKIVALYDAKATLIGVELAKTSQKQEDCHVVAVIATGFLVTLSSYLALIQLKKISQSPLICCSFCYAREDDIKVVAMDCTGRLINQNGQVINSTGIKESLWLGTVKSTNQFLLLSPSNQLFSGELTGSNVLHANQETREYDWKQRNHKLTKNNATILTSHRR